MSDTLAALVSARTRVAVLLTALMMAVYFGFILLVAFNKPLLGRQLVPGLSVGIAIGIFVIISAWVLVWIYVRWANAHYDHNVKRLQDER